MEGQKYEALLRSVDAIIADHGETNPELKTALADLRERLKEAHRCSPLEVANIGVRIFELARWIYDQLPPPH